MATFTVTNTNNSGTGSLRQAVLNANDNSGEDKIVFNSSLTGSTINLTSGQIRIDDDLTIEGLGSENLTIDAGGNSRVFEVTDDNFSGSENLLDVTLEGLTITEGSTSGNGGAILASDGFFTSVNLTISDSEITNSTAGSDGGAIYGEGANIRIVDSILRGNSAGGDGGAIHGEGGTSFVDILRSSILGNSAVGSSGGIFSPGNGGGINAEGRVRISRSTFRDNTANNYGGGLYGEEITLLTSTFNDNQANLQGGGIYTNGATIIINSNISSNATTGSGGGISVNTGILNIGERALIANTTISENTAFGNGGGIKLGGGLRGNEETPEGDLVLLNVTITNNVADINNNGIGDGGGIYNPQIEQLGSITEIPGTLILGNTILAGNFDTPNNNGVGFIAPDISGSARGNANNLLGDDQGLTQDLVGSSVLLGTGTDIKNVNPGLGALQDNGGLTLTHALLTGSPAINGGNNNLILTETFFDVDGDGQQELFDFDGDPNTNNAQLPYDQRQIANLYPRIVGDIVDIGAYEVPDESRNLSTINFDEGNLAAGTIITDQFDGITISTSSIRNSSSLEFGVILFDTENPTGGDDDLAANLGNVLIISEDGDSTDPDDNAGGGTFNIEFDTLATVTSIGFLDIDEPGSVIRLFNEGLRLNEVIEIPALGDGSLQEIIPNLQGQGIALIEIELAGSGALTELNFFDTPISTINFDEGNLDAGTRITDQFDGISISSESAVLIFDTENPTGDDTDLATTNLGNVLIISEDGDTADPDDNILGGTINIEFDELTTVRNIGFLDIDEPGSVIRLFNDDSGLIEVIEIPALEDGSLQEIIPNSRTVDLMEIELAGSGALTHLEFFDTFDQSGDIF